MFNLLETDNLKEGLIKLNEWLNNTYNHTSTQWATTLPNTDINDGQILNILTLLTDANKVAGGTVARDEYSIVSNGIIIPYVGKPYEGQRLHHFIRVNFNFVTGSSQDLILQLRRVVDNSVIGSGIRVSRSNDNGGIQEIFETYTNNELDPFVTGGFYISIQNQSGSNIDITGSLGVLIQTFYEKSTLFV